MLAEAEQETLAVLLLDPEQLDARSMLGVIYARLGDKDRAISQWRELLCDAADYDPALTNLEILDGKQASAVADSALDPLTRRTFHGFLSKNYAVRPQSKKNGRRWRKLLMIRLIDMAQLLLNCATYRLPREVRVRVL